MYRILLPTLGCLLTCMPLITQADADCDTSYQNMYVYVTINNKLNSTMICSVSDMHGSWDPSAPSSVFDQIASGDSPEATACYNDNGDDKVSGTITCYNTIISGGIPTKSQEIGTMSFNHKCESSLNHAGDGSCVWSEYSNSVSEVPMNNFNITDSHGTDNDALTVTYKVSQS